jgi:CRP-like cAMP-binding protein
MVADEPPAHSASFVRRLDALPRVPLFSSLPADELVALIDHLSVERRKPGEMIIAEGTPGEAMYIVVSGQVEVTRGGAANVLARLGEGSFFGELALITSDPRTATVTAVEPTEMLVMSRHVMGELIAAYPESLSTILSFVRGRLVATLLATSPLFLSFEMEERRELAAEFELREIEPGTVLCAEGKRAEALQIILAGQVSLAQGAQPAGTLGAGDVVGEQSFLGSTSSVTVTAARRVWTLALPRARFQEVVLSRPQILVYLSELSDTRASAGPAAGRLGMV